MVSLKAPIDTQAVLARQRAPTNNTISSSLIDVVNDRLRDNVVELVTHITGSPPNKSLSRKGEARFGSKGGIAVTTTGPAKGRITMFDGDGKGMSPFQFIQDQMNCSFTEAVEWAANWLGMSPDYTPDPEVERRREEKRERDRREAEVMDKRERRQKISTAEDIAKKSVPVAGTNAEAYLRGRAITASLPECFRYAPSPSALLAIATTPNGDVQAVQRIFLDGDRKANVVPQKRTNGPIKNAAVRIPGKGNRLYLAEGPETALSVGQATGAPTWAVLGQNFRDHDIPDGITEIGIAADNDPDGSTAFKQTKKSAEHYHQLGYAVFIARLEGPPKYDFNDVHQEQGEIAVRNILEAAQLWSGAPALYQLPTGTVDKARNETTAFIMEWVVKTIEYWKQKAEYDATH